MTVQRKKPEVTFQGCLHASMNPKSHIDDTSSSDSNRKNEAKISMPVNVERDIRDPIAKKPTITFRGLLHSSLIPKSAVDQKAWMEVLE